MSNRSSSPAQRRNPISRLRRPEYTGENRCLPCTVLNVAIAAGSAVVVGLVAPLLGVGVFLAAVVVIWFRGYLLPGTPALTARYLPERVQRAFGHKTTVATEPIDLDVERALIDARVVTACADTDDLCLTETYRTALQDEHRQLHSETAQRDRLAASLSVSAGALAFDDAENGWFVSVDGARIGGWDSKAAFLADLANQALLAASLPEWETLSPAIRTQLLAALRSFVETCPDCGGRVVPAETVVESCCQSDVISTTTTCVDCAAVVFTGTGDRAR